MRSGRFALESATTTRKEQFHVREKQQKHSQSSMNELIKQIRKQREAIGFEIPVIRGAFDQEEGSIDDKEYFHGP